MRDRGEVDDRVNAVDERAAIELGADESVSTPELVSRIARMLGRPARLLPVPPALLRMAGMIAGRRDDIRRLTGNLAIDSLRARRLLDWRPPYTLDAGLAQTARWFRSARA